MELFGWTSSEEVANEVWCSIHSSLLKGELLLGYKNTSGDGDIQQLIIVRFENNLFGIGLIANGFTELLPDMPKEYFNIFIEELKSQKSVGLTPISDLDDDETVSVGNSNNNIDDLFNRSL